MPLVRLPCGSESMTRIFSFSRARKVERFRAVVVLPTPPFWLVIAITLLTADYSASSECCISLFYNRSAGMRGRASGQLWPAPSRSFLEHRVSWSFQCPLWLKEEHLSSELRTLP